MTFSRLAQIALALLLATSPLAAQPLDPSRVDWRSLDFKAFKFFVSATTTVQISQVQPGVGEISFDTEAVGRRTSDTIRFRLDDANTLARHKQKHGKSPYAKHFLYGEEQITMERSEPADVDEATGDPKSWSRRNTEIFESPGAACRRIVDPSLVLYLAAARTWRVGDPPFEVCTFSDAKFSRLIIEVAGEEDIDVDYETVRPDGTTAKQKETVKALLLTLDAETFDPSGEDHLEVLGLEEDVCMYVDPKTGAPLRFTGKMDNLGRVEVNLQRLVLR